MFSQLIKLKPLSPKQNKK